MSINIKGTNQQNKKIILTLLCIAISISVILIVYFMINNKKEATSNDLQLTQATAYNTLASTTECNTLVPTTQCNTLTPTTAYITLTPIPTMASLAPTKAYNTVAPTKAYKTAVPTKAYKTVAPTKASKTATPTSNSKSSTSTAKYKDGWNLVLVNKWNPLTDDSEIELTKLSNGQCVDSRIYPSLQEMFDDARASKVYPIVVSGYRTSKDQQKIYDNKYKQYKSQGLSDAEAKIETEKWVAIPGTSEHQLGLAVDINADGVHSTGSQVYTWLSKHAHLYGFINRYPKDKEDITGISNEPWHYRYVGVEVATEIYNKKICLEEYLGKTQ